jgi:hypothetical protein
MNIPEYKLWSRIMEECGALIEDAKLANEANQGDNFLIQGLKEENRPFDLEALRESMDLRFKIGEAHGQLTAAQRIIELLGAWKKTSEA